MSKQEYKTSTAGLIPSDWKIASLEKFASVKYGISDSLNKTLNNGIRILALPNVTKEGKFVPEPEYFVDKEKISKKDLLQNGDILFNWRNGSKEHVGKTLLIDFKGEYTHVGFLLRIRIHNHRLNCNYLHFYLKFIKQRDYFARAKFQVNSSFNKSELLELPIVLPSSEEQQKIAEILSTWDEAIRITEKIIAALEKRKKGIMQRLLTGQLRFPGFTDEWKKYKFTEFVKKRNEKVDPKNISENIVCIELEHISQNTGKITGKTNLSLQKSIKNKFYEGDILFGKLRPNLRKFANPQFNGVCSSEIWVFNCNSLCKNIFLFYLLQTNKFYNISNITSGTKMPRSEWNNISNEVFNLPSINEQNIISSVLEAIDNEINFNINKCEILKQQKQGLMQRLLSGQLRVKP